MFKISYVWKGHKCVVEETFPNIVRARDAARVIAHALGIGVRVDEVLA
jgi:hypothetical protein